MKSRALDLSLKYPSRWVHGLEVQAALTPSTSLTTINFTSLTNPTPNLPFNSSGNLVNGKNGFGAVDGVRPPRIMQVVARFVF